MTVEAEFSAFTPGTEKIIRCAAMAGRYAAQLQFNERIDSASAPDFTAVDVDGGKEEFDGKEADLPQQEASGEPVEKLAAEIKKEATFEAGFYLPL